MMSRRRNRRNKKNDDDLEIKNGKREVVMIAVRGKSRKKRGKEERVRGAAGPRLPEHKRARE